MANLADEIKQIIRDYLQNENQCDVCYATFTGSSIKIDNKPMPVPIDMVVIPKHLREKEVDGVKNVFVLKSGDRVVSNAGYENV